MYIAELHYAPRALSLGWMDHSAPWNIFGSVTSTLYGCGKQFEVADSLKHDIITSFDSTSDPEPQNLSQVGWVYCVRLLPYAFGQHINVLKHFVYVQYGYGKQFEVADSLNHDSITSFDSTSDPEPQNLSQVGWITV